MMDNLLEIQGLTTLLQTKKTAQVLIKEINLMIPRGQVVGIVGESGSGKSLTMKSIMNLLPEQMAASFTSFIFDGQKLEKPKKLPISMIFQDPMTSLNPLRTIGYHLVEVIRRQQKVSKKAAQALAILELKKVGIPLAEKRIRQYPHELSGGMRQRVMIAMALLAQPQLLIADEPTTALDVTIQAQILALIQNLQQSEKLSVILVTHDLGVVAGMCDLVKVMYQGQIVEEGTVEEIFYDARHPYTKQLLEAARLGEKESPGRLLDYQEPLANHLVKQTFSATHHIWVCQEEGNLS